MLFKLMLLLRLEPLSVSLFLSLLQSSPISGRAHCFLLCPLLGLLLKVLGDFILLASFRFTTKLDVLGVR